MNIFLGCPGARGSHYFKNKNYEDKAMSIVLRKKLQEFRKDANFTIQKLAKELGVVKSYISMIESGQRQPNLKILKKYADYFNCPLEYLVLLLETENRELDEGLKKNLDELSRHLFEFHAYKKQVLKGEKESS